MIQRMNNVLIKHSKVLFGVITIVIIISFVWFFTPGADGSLLFGNNSNEIAKINDTKVTISDAERVQKSSILASASSLYAAYGEKSAEYLTRMGRINDDQLRILAATIKLAEIKGFAVADSEVQDVIKKDPAFHGNGKFSLQKYKAFLACLDSIGFSTEDYENATRDALLLQKFQESAIAGVTEPSMNEVEEDIKPLLFTLTDKNIICDTAEIKKTLAAPKEEELKAEFDKNPEGFVSLPSSDTTIFFINHKDVKVADLDKQANDLFKAFANVEGHKMTLDEAKKNIVTAEAQKLLSDLMKAAGEKPTAETLKAAAAKQNVKLLEISLPDVTMETAPGSKAEKELIYSICAIREVGEFSRVVTNKDSAAVALLTKRTEPQKLDFEAAKKQITEILQTQKAFKLAEERLNALKADITAGKVALDKIDEEARKKGLTVEEGTTMNNADAFLKSYDSLNEISAMLQELRMAYGSGNQKRLMELTNGSDPEQFALYLQNLQRQLAASLPTHYDLKAGFTTPVYGNSFRVIVKAEPVQLTPELLQRHKAYLFNRKKEAAFQSWQAWYEKEITAAIAPYVQKQEAPAAK